jgi:chromosome segregation ATPase
LGSLLVVLGATGAMGQARTAADNAHPAADETAGALLRISESLRDIGESLRAIRVDQRALLLARRVEIAERRLVPLQDEFRESRSEVLSLKEEVEHLTSLLESTEDAIETKLREGADPSRIPEREEQRQIELAMETMKSRLERAESRVIERENDLQRARREVEILDERLRDWLAQNQE